MDLERDTTRGTNPLIPATRSKLTLGLTTALMMTISACVPLGDSDGDAASTDVTTTSADETSTDDVTDDDEVDDAEDTNSEDSDESTTDTEPASDTQDGELLMVMDASGSMDESDAGDTTRIEAARDALDDVIDGFQNRERVGLRVFSSEVTDPDADGACEDSELVIPVGEDNREDLREAIDSYDAVGGRTPMAYALEEAAADLGDDGPRTIVLVSDGEENCVPDPCEVADTITAQGIDLTIHTVGYEVDDDAREDLQCIASAGDGEYYDAADSDSLNRALERVSKRAFQPFTLTGEEITGAENWGDSPTLETGTQYIDEFAESTLHYRIPRYMDLSSLHVGLTTHNDPDHTDWVNMRIETWEGDTCERASMVGRSFATRNFLRTVQASVAHDPESEAEEDPCIEDDELVLAVEFQRDADEVGTIGQPFELLVVEEPHAQNAASLPEAMDRDDIQWEDMGRDAQGAQEVFAGSSFNDAPPLEPGTTYDGDILPGETLVFRVLVDWGERLQAEAFFAEPHEELSDRIADVGSVGLTVLSPHRGEIDDDFGRLSSNRASEYQVSTPEVRWNNRHTNPSWMNPAALDGDYYLVLAADEHGEGDSFAIPYRLTVQNFGTGGDGAPEYPDDEEVLFPIRGDEDDDPDEDQDDSED